MTIKSLLLGSAAALAAVSGARAADAPVTLVEPEPVEYVRICDAYGEGFFYIPGTETCLKIGGYVRLRIQANDEQFNGFTSDVDTNGDGIADTTITDRDDYVAGTRTRGRMEFDAREETELGTLRSKIRIEAQNTFSTDAGFIMDEGYIQLGGLTVGYLDSLWTHNDGGIEDGLLLDEYEFAAGDFNQQRISYTFAGNGFSATASIEDDGDGDFTPDILGKLAYKGKWGGAYLLGVYDEDSADTFQTRRGVNPLGATALYSFGTGEFGDGDGSDGAFVVKAGLQLQNLLTAKSILKVEGHYAFDPSVYARVGDVGRVGTGGNNDFNQSLTSRNGGFFNFPSQWQVGAGYRQDLGKLFLIADGIYGRTFDLNASTPGFTFGNVGEIDYWGVGGSVGYKMTKNFTVKTEVSYVDLDLPAGIDDFDQTRGFLEFRRDF